MTAKLNSYKKISGGDDLTARQRQGLDEFMRRYNAMTPKSKEMAQRHRQHYADPRSVTGFSKLWKEICYQIAHEKSKGAHIWDVDGNHYVDYVMSYGVALFGHMPDFVEEAVAAALKKGNSIDLLPPESTDVARLLCEMSGFDRATLANTGTEAVLGAVRAARTITGREKIAVFDTDYHGMVDEFMVRGVHFKSRPDGSGGESKALPSSPGVPKFLVENALVLDYDDPEVLEKLEKQIKELAAVVIEPVQAQNPHWQHGKLIKAIRRLTEQHGVALIFDEIINGFRLDQRGAQAWYGVDADLCAYGKSISGGLPLAAVAGKAKYMNAFDGGLWHYGDDSSPEGVIAYFASTFIKNPISVSAAYAALSEIQRRGPAMQQELNEKTARFAKRIADIFRRTKAPLMIQSASSFFMIKNADASPLTRLFNYFLRARSINIRERPCFISTAHTEADFEKTYRGFEDAIHDMFAAGLMEVWEGEDLNVIVSMPKSLHPANLDVSENSILTTKFTGQSGATTHHSILATQHFCTTEGQQEIFLSDQFGPEASKAYNIGTEIRLEGDFDLEKIQASIQALVHRHEALRTTFSADGHTMMVHPAMEVDIPFTDLSLTPGPSPKERGGMAVPPPSEVDGGRLNTLRHTEAEHLFDLQTGPLVRFQIIRLEEKVHLVFITVHHIICDGWSLGILTRELGEMYGADFRNIKDVENLTTAKQVSEFAMDQATLQHSPVFQKNENYWLGQYASGVPVVELPTDCARPPVKTFPGAVEKISFDEAFTIQLRKAAAKQGATFYVFMLAAYQAFLHRLTGQDDLVVGVAAAGHNLPGNSGLVAHAIGMLPVRTQLKETDTFGDYLKTVRRQVLDAFDHQQYTFGALVKKLKMPRDASRNTLVSVAFNLDSPLDDLKFGKLKANTQALPRHFETFDTFINLKPLGPCVDFEWNFNTDLFRRETIRLRLAEFEAFLRGVAVDATVDGAAQSPIISIPLLPDFEKKQLEKFGHGRVGREYPVHLGLHGLFEQQVKRTPGKTAVIFENESLSYQELNDRTNALATFLIQKGLQAGQFAGLCIGRSVEMLVGMYAILKAGGAYVPMDPHNPADRIAHMLKDAGCRHLVTEKSLLASLPKFDGETIAVDSIASSYSTLNTQHSSLINLQSPAYLIYTSGSTGLPKGVVVSHENVVHLLHAINENYRLDETGTHLAVASMTFDISVLDFFLPLATGATLVLAAEPETKDGFALRDLVERHRPNTMQATPTTWEMLVLAGWEGQADIRILAGGEAFSKELSGRLAACCGEVWNGYGPTEATIYATWQRVTKEHLDQMPGEFAAIGQPLAGVETYILDKNGQPAPIGVPGELFIGGKGVAQGYLNRPELTNEKFIYDLRFTTDEANNRNSSIVNRKLYKTGDLARYLSSGEIDFLGRLDNQVKIRGFRIELGEIEEAIKQYPGVVQGAAKVVARQQLAGYYVAAEGAEVDEKQLKNFLGGRLPAYMVPFFFIKMSAMPLNASMKLNRKALPEPDLSVVSEADFAVPSTAAEKLLVDIWENLLGVQPISVHDDFFELGGHSLSAVGLMSKIKQETGKKLPLTALFQFPTVHKLATQLNGLNSKPLNGQSGIPIETETFGSLIPIRRGQGKAPLYLIHGGGLHVLFYQNMVKYLDNDQPIFALQAKGLNEGETPLDCIEDMAAHYISEILQQNPNGEYCLAGYSLGGLIAWEMARQLKAMGKEVPMLAMFDSVAKYEWAGAGESGKWKKKMMKTGFNLSLMLKDPARALEYKSNVLKMQRQHRKGKLLMAYRNGKTNSIEEGYLPFGQDVYQKSMEAYEKYELQPLGIHVDLFRAKEQMFYLHDPQHYGWDKFALEGVTVHEIGGNHLTLFDEPHGREIANAMKQRLHAMQNAV